MLVGLGTGRIVLDGDGAPQFLAHICCVQMAAGIKMALGTELGLGPGDVVLDGDPVVPSPKGGGERTPQIFGPCLL